VGFTILLIACPVFGYICIYLDMDMDNRGIIYIYNVDKITEIRKLRNGHPLVVTTIRTL